MKGIDVNNACAEDILIAALLGMPKPRTKRRETPIRRQLNVLKPYIMKALNDGHKIVDIYEALAKTGVFLGSYQILRLTINEWRNYDEKY